MVRAQQIRAMLRAGFDDMWREIDLLSTPTMPYGAPELGDPARNITFTAPFNTLGWPAITVPVGLAPGNLPLGLQLVGKPWDEVTVLRAANVVESDGPWTDFRVPADRPA
jgi:aspartyl-tRNA(Asn)/glutamyl-tRNA(Gln) amidotransferase subunit A